MALYKIKPLIDGKELSEIIEHCEGDTTAIAIILAYRYEEDRRVLAESIKALEQELRRITLAAGEELMAS